nr:AMP-binding protein [Williamsia soli]
MRLTPDHLAAHYVKSGWWTDDTIGDLLSSGLAEHGDITFEVHSATRPWPGTFAVVERQHADWLADSEPEASDPFTDTVPIDPSDPALIAFTSGTTTAAKGVVHSHRTLGFETRQLGSRHPADSHPQITGAPVGHFIGMVSALLLPVMSGHPGASHRHLGSGARDSAHGGARCEGRRRGTVLRDEPARTSRLHPAVAPSQVSRSRSPTMARSSPADQICSSATPTMS